VLYLYVKVNEIMIKLKNVLAENMRRFGTKNLNEDDNSYKVSQENARLNKIANTVIRNYVLLVLMISMLKKMKILEVHHTKYHKQYHHPECLID
jgi:hypothetical protein